MTEKAKLTMIVAGGGIGGLSAALGLANKGCTVTSPTAPCCRSN
jgi:succinate dehydrogenase/fumarate reductase flavoprotein subunit